MPRSCFLGAGLATTLGTGITANLDGLQQPPRPPRSVERCLGDTCEAIPYKPLADFPEHDDPAERLSLALKTVAAEALTRAGLSAAQQQRMGIFVGSSSFAIATTEQHYRQALQDDTPWVPLQDPSFADTAEALRAAFGITGPDFSFNTACTASANAAWYAARMIEAGWLDHALVVGLELINDITAWGFYGLDLLTRSVMRPFDADRDGLVLGESVSALVLGPAPDRATWRLTGGANLCDTHSMSAANADGTTVSAVIHDALSIAGCPPDTVAGIKTHGTASLLNDEAESAGLQQVFTALPPVTALKPHIGHTLGACGLSELLLIWQAAEAGFFPATPGIGADPAALGVTLTQSPSPRPNGPLLLNYFGFGGNNTALVIEPVGGDAA